MKLSELIALINSRYSGYDEELMIVTKLPYQTVGAHPMTKVKSITYGFDWEQGKIMIWPEEDLYPSNEELNEKFKKMQKQSHDLFMKNMDLEREIKRLKNV